MTPFPIPGSRGRHAPAHPGPESPGLTRGREFCGTELPPLPSTDRDPGIGGGAFSRENSGKTKEALLELKAALERNPELVAHFPVEIRFSRGDEILLSPCFRRDSCYINVIMYRPYGKDIPRLEYWRTYERIMKKHGGRPHWAKAHSCTRKDLEKMYPAFPEFCAIREKLDPTGIFLNAYLERVFY